MSDLSSENRSRTSDKQYQGNIFCKSHRRQNSGYRSCDPRLGKMGQSYSRSVSVAGSGVPIFRVTYAGYGSKGRCSSNHTRCTCCRRARACDCRRGFENMAQNSRTRKTRNVPRPLHVRENRSDFVNKVHSLRIRNSDICSLCVGLLFCLVRLQSARKLSNDYNGIWPRRFGGWLMAGPVPC